MDSAVIVIVVITLTAAQVLVSGSGDTNVPVAHKSQEIANI